MKLLNVNHCCSKLALQISSYSDAIDQYCIECKAKKCLIGSVESIMVRSNLPGFLSEMLPAPQVRSPVLFTTKRLVAVCAPAASQQMRLHRPCMLFALHVGLHHAMPLHVHRLRGFKRAVLADWIILASLNPT